MRHTGRSHEVTSGQEGKSSRSKSAKSHCSIEPETAIAEGRWTLQHLGGGSRYEVHLVWDERVCSLLVAKILRPSHSQDERALRDLQREAEVLSKIVHPVIVRGFGLVLNSPYPHILIEHLEGPTLRRLIRHGALPLDQLLPLALHVAGALHYLSVEGLVHLDVKPDNIVMGVPPRLIDLSIARSAERAARLREPIGTDAYMAPEQCDPTYNPGSVGPPADVWGLGASLYHAATGALPFPRAASARTSDDIAIRFPQVVSAPTPFPSHTPELVRELILRMLAKNPGERPSAREVALALEPLVGLLPSRLRFSRRGHMRAFSTEEVTTLLAERRAIPGTLT